MRDRMDVSIRFCADTDLPAILRIYNQAIENGVATWDEAPWTMAERQTWFAGHDASTPILVAQAADEVIGFAYLTFMSAKSGWRRIRTLSYGASGTSGVGPDAAGIPGGPM